MYLNLPRKPQPKRTFRKECGGDTNPTRSREPAVQLPRKGSRTYKILNVLLLLLGGHTLVISSAFVCIFGLFFSVIFYHGIHHHEHPPFGRICVYFFQAPTSKSKEIDLHFLPVLFWCDEKTGDVNLDQEQGIFWLLTTQKSWDDPPSIPSHGSYMGMTPFLLIPPSVPM